MPLYCYICYDCGRRFEDFNRIDEHPKTCGCGGEIFRDYQKEGVAIFDDITPYFDFSIGEYITGRRDKATKYAAGGYTPLAGGHGGDSVRPYKQFYGDERYKTEVIDAPPKTDLDRKFDDEYIKRTELGLSSKEVEP
jgi:putative FmdB family regulatory protein